MPSQRSKTSPERDLAPLMRGPAFTMKASEICEQRLDEMICILRCCRLGAGWQHLRLTRYRLFDVIEERSRL